MDTDSGISDLNISGDENNSVIDQLEKQERINSKLKECLNEQRSQIDKLYDKYLTMRTVKVIMTYCPNALLN